MSNIKCIIIEDEPLAVKVLADYVSEVPFLDLQGTFKDAILASLRRLIISMQLKDLI
jgi:two-component system, LytTR family, response regulator